MSAGPALWITRQWNASCGFKASKPWRLRGKTHSWPVRCHKVVYQFLSCQGTDMHLACDHRCCPFRSSDWQLWSHPPIHPSFGPPAVSFSRWTLLGCWKAIESGRLWFIFCLYLSSKFWVYLSKYICLVFSYCSKDIPEEHSDWGPIILESKCKSSCSGAHL